jgi:hypothetical protein
MPIFLERFILPILATLVTGVCVFNPWKWDWHQRVSLFLGVACLAYFFAYTSFRSRPEATRTAVPAIDAPQKTGDATATGPNSVANTGNGNTINQSPPPENKPPKKE